MNKGGMETFGRLVLRSPRLWNEPSLQAMMNELAEAGLVGEQLDARLHGLSPETGFSVADLRELLAVAECWREGHAARSSALAA